MEPGVGLAAARIAETGQSSDPFAFVQEAEGAMKAAALLFPLAWNPDELVTL